MYYSGGVASLRPSYYRAFFVSMQVPQSWEKLNTHCRNIAPSSDYLFEQLLVFESDIYTNYLIA